MRPESTTMGFYEREVLPWLTHLVMRQPPLTVYRRRVLEHAVGEVLEIGMGSGLNLPLYGQRVTSVLSVEPSGPLAAMARKVAGRVTMPLMVIEQSAEELPLPDHSIDTAVTTWTLCTIPDPLRALREVRRVLRPEGRLIFVEHGLAPDLSVARWQRRLTPMWKRCAGGCHLDGPTADLICRAGFHITELGTGYMPGPRPMTFMSEGVAQKC